MRTLLLAMLGLGLIATAFATSASAESVCTPRDLGLPTGACAGAGPCRTHTTEGICAGGFVAGVGGVHATCQHHAMDAGFCSLGGGAMGNPVGASLACQQLRGVGCHAGVGGVGGAAFRAGPGGACVGAGVRALDQGVAQCVPVPSPP